MKWFKILPVLSLIVMACTSPNEKRTIFDSGGQKPITSFLSKKFNTVSILFGNELALQSAKRATGARGGEVFTLVTWNQEEKKFWYPALINGSIKSIETLKLSLLNNKVSSSYTLVRGAAPTNAAHIRFTERERIVFMMSQKASVYP